MYRALTHLANPEESLPIILSRELTSSLIDYYDAVIEALVVIANDASQLRHLKPDAIRVIDLLVNDGYSDHRLQKVRVALTGVVTPNVGACLSVAQYLPDWFQMHALFGLTE